MRGIYQWFNGYWYLIGSPLFDCCILEKYFLNNTIDGIVLLANYFMIKVQKRKFIEILRRSTDKAAISILM